MKHPESPPLEERVSVLDIIDVPSAVLQTLAKGPKFVIAPKISREILQQAVQVEVAALAYALRWSAVQQPLTPTTSDSAIPPSLNKFCPIHSQRKEPPRDNIEVEKKIQALQTDLQRLVTYCDLSIKPNITRAERDGIMDLCSREDSIITKSDKGGELVVMEELHLKRLCMENLSEKSPYQKLKTMTPD